MTRVSASESGDASAEMATYYEPFVKGGFGLIITEGAYTDQAFAQGYLYQPGISDEAQAEAWVDEDIADTIAGFAVSAARAIAVSGFDGIELHAANGYLLDQFLTDVSNRRQDRRGGDACQRMTMIEKVFRAVRQALPGSVPVRVRISQGKVDNLTHKWTEGEGAAEAVFGTLSDLGADFIHVTEHDALAPAFEPGGPTLIALARRFAPQAALIADGSDRRSMQESTSLPSASQRSPIPISTRGFVWAISWQRLTRESCGRSRISSLRSWSRFLPEQRKRDVLHFIPRSTDEAFL